MTPMPSVVGVVARTGWLGRFRNRALVFGIAIVLAAIAAVFPARYRAQVTMTPIDPGSLGLSGTLSQLGAVNGAFGNQAAVEIALRVAGSITVRDDVIRQTRLAERLGRSDRLALHRWLADRIGIRSLRGGIVMIDIKLTDAALARDIVDAYASAARARLAQISRAQTAYKRDVLMQLVSEASTRLQAAQDRYNRFRLGQRTPLPEGQVATVNQRLVQLESAIKAHEVNLQAAQSVYAPGNTLIQQMQAELAALRRQLALARATGPGGESSVGRAVATSSQLFRLERDLGIARALYDSYLRFLQGTSVEDLTSTANVRILEPPAVDTERQIWWPGASLAIGLALLWAAVEFYRLRPPVGARIVRHG